MNRAARSQITIVERYRDYAPIVPVAGTVRLLLRYVPPEHLAGLRTVLLTNSTSSRDLRRGKTVSRGRRVAKRECGGFYQDGQIDLLVDNILGRVPAWSIRVPAFRAGIVAEVLYHEIGHHIHATQRPDHREREAVADEWGNRLFRSFARRRYWYLVWPGRLVVAIVSRLFPHIRDRVTSVRS